MSLHYINNNKFNIERGDTLKHTTNWDDESFNAIVPNPPEPVLNWDGIFFCPNLQGLARDRIRKICFKYDLGRIFLIFLLFK